MNEIELAERRALRATQSNAIALWIRLRREAGFTRFIDTAALRAVRTSIERCSSRVQWRDIEAAIRLHASDERCPSPWYLDQWIEATRDTRERAEGAALPVEVQLARMKKARR